LNINSQEQAEGQEKKATLEHQGLNNEMKELPDD